MVPTELGLLTCGKSRTDCQRCICGRNDFKCTIYCQCVSEQCQNRDSNYTTQLLHSVNLIDGESEDDDFNSTRDDYDASIQVDEEEEEEEAFRNNIQCKLPLTPTASSQLTTSTVTSKPCPKSRRTTRKAAPLVNDENVPIVTSTPKRRTVSTHHRCYSQFDPLQDIDDAF
ncbi:unnamed protein product [Didymodactylos carnosus]|uniref:Uncharacterized protein n=1 Tax=Didymodactylos carnosus TaxID=1234261 RepID=A0A8S2UU40_9BILA|nr:unnamed protein product [Didymodactylos carnosus]